MRDVAILSAVRTPIGRAPQGRLQATPAPTISAALVVARGDRAAPRSTRPRIEDVVLGCAHPEAEQGLNVARQVGLLAGLPDDDAGDDHQPLLLVGPAGDRHRRRPHRRRRHRRRPGRRPRVDVADPDGRRQDRAQPGGRRAVPRRLHPDGQHRRERGPPVRRQPRRSGRVRAAPATRRRSRPGRAATSPPRCCPSRRASSTARSGATSPSTATRGRAPTPRWRSWRRSSRPSIRPARVTAGNSSPLNDGAAAVVLMAGDKAKAAGQEAARVLPRLRRRRRAAGDHGHRPGAGGAQAAGARPASRSTRSISSRSTRRSPRRRSTACASSGLPPTG